MAYTIRPKASINMVLISNDELLIQTLSQELPLWGINIYLSIELRDICLKAKSETPAVILLDADMEIDNHGITSILKLKRLTNRPAIIVCIGDRTADSFKVLFEKMKRMKQVYFISKPVLPKSLISLINDIFLSNDKRDAMTFKNDLLTHERRKSIRAKVNFSLSCQFLKKTEKPPVFCQVEVQVKDISRGGMMLEIQKPTFLPKDIGLEFSLFPKQPKIMVNGEIKWKHTGKLPHLQNIGLKFKDINVQAQDMIAQHVYTYIMSKSV